MTPLRKGIRTFIQVAAAAVVGLGALVAGGVITAQQAAWIGAVLTFLSGVATAAMNSLEDHDVIPALLRPLDKPRKRTRT